MKASFSDAGPSRTPTPTHDLICKKNQINDAKFLADKGSIQKRSERGDWAERRSALVLLPA